MKKISLYIELLALSLLTIPFKAFAACATPDPNLADVQGLFSVQYCTANSAVVRVITILLSIIGVVSALMVVIGGYRYVVSQGNEKAVSSARKTLTYALAGLVVAVLAYSIVSIINRSIS